MDIIKKIVLSMAFCVLFGTMMAYGGRQTVLTQRMLDNANGTFVVNKDYTAEGATLYLPNRFKLVFEGGKIDHVELVGNHTTLQVQATMPIFGKDIRISGSWDVDEAHDGWFEYEEGRGFISNQLINNMLAFSDDDSFCHLFFEEDRTYYFELPYKGNAKLGDEFTYHINDKGKKKRHYKEVYNEDYAFLRIFTIPSNTIVTVNNTLQMLPTNLGAYFVFWEYNKENVTIDGSGTIAGDNKEHFYTSPYAGKYYYGEWGILFQCFKCKNFIFRDITLRDAFGDCILYQGSYVNNENGSRYADGLLIENVKIIGARRNGIAIGARNVIIRNCHFEGCGTETAKGTPPRCAIDFEPDGVKNYPEIGNQNVLLENCTFEDNYFDIGSYRNNLSDYGQLATTIKNCIFTAPLKIEGTYWMRFENCYIPFVWNSKDDKSKILYSKHLEFVDCEFGQWDDAIPKKKSKTNSYINCNFNVGNYKNNANNSGDKKTLIKIGKPKSK